MTERDSVWSPERLGEGAAAEVLAAIVESANVAIIRVDRDGRVVSWNRAATELYGWSEAEVLGRNTEFLTPERFVELHRTRYAETFVGGHEHSMETTRRRKDGTEVAVSLTAFPIRDTRGRIVGGASISRDITAELRTRKALEASEGRFRVLFETMSDGVVLQDGRGKVVSFNQRALAILHVSEAELRGTTMRDPRWRPIFSDGTPCRPEQHPSAIALSTGRPVSDVLLGMPLEGGQIAWVLVNATPLEGAEDGAPSGVVVTFADFTSRKAALDALSDSEARFRMALATIQTGVFLSDGERLCFVNEALGSMLGYERDELLAMEGKDFESILGAEDLRRVLERAEDLLSGEDVPPTMEVQATRRDGSQGLFELRATLLPTSVGTQLLVAVVDLTERAAAARLKDELLGLVSHELRTPLTTLLGNAQLLTRKDRVVSDRERAVGLKEIQRDAQRLEQVLENMMLLSQTNGTPAPLEPLLLQRVVPEVVREQHQRVPQQKIRVTIAEDLPPVLGHAGYSRQILLNLFSNAAKYAGVKRPVELDIREEGNEVRVTVSDGGPGIDPATMARVFEPFYRAGAASRRAPGMGLGLTVCKRLVELQGGQISVGSKEGGGTTFAFTLPLLDAADE